MSLITEFLSLIICVEIRDDFYQDIFIKTVLYPLPHCPLFRSGFPEHPSGRDIGLTKFRELSKTRGEELHFPGFATTVSGERRTPYPVHPLFVQAYQHL